MAHSAGLLDQFPPAPCGGFHLQENWDWQDPVFSAIYVKPCTHLDTLCFPRTMWRLSFAHWYMACILFRLLCLILFDFPLLHSISVKGFYAFTSHVLNTLRQHIWCSHFPWNVCTWKPHSGMKQCVFSLRTESILQPPGRTFLLLKQTPCSDWLDTMVPASRTWRPVAYLRGHLEMWGFLFLGIVPTFIGAQNCLAFPTAWLFLRRSWLEKQAPRTKMKMKASFFFFLTCRKQVNFYMCSGSCQHLIFPPSALLCSVSFNWEDSEEYLS